MKIDGQLTRAQLECLGSDPGNTIAGRIWWRTDSSVVKLATGSSYITLTSGAPDGSSLQNVADVWAVKALGVTNAMLAGSIAYAKLSLSNSIVAGDLTANCVTTVKILDGNVTSAKCQNDINLPGTTVAAGSKYIVLSNTNPAAKGLNIVRGKVTGSSGAVHDGEGFTVNRSSAGVYGVTYSTAFYDLPTVAIEVANSATDTYVVSTPLAGSFTITFGGDTNFGIIAVGQRT